jgi:hypothetical protein
MRRLFGLAVILSAGAVAGCTDSPPTGQPSFDAAAGSGGGGTSAASAGTNGGGGTSAASAGTNGGGGSGGGGSGGGGSGGGALAGAGGVAGGGAGHPGIDAGVDAPSVGGTSGAAGTVGGTGGSAGTGGGAGGAAGVSQLAPPAATGLVALNSDFSTTSLSILSTAGGLLHADCVDSATGSNGSSSKTISGITQLPSQPQRGGAVVIVDSGNGALTFVDPVQCKITRQISIPGGAKTDPLDVVILSDTKAYVTRYTKNLAATDPALAGNDIVVMNPITGARIGQIGLDAYASVVPGATILVRPDKAIIANGKVVVTLNEIDAGYAHYGEGKIVVVDPATDQVVASVALTGLYDCQGMDYVAATKTLLVSCGGAFHSQNQPLESGIAVVDLGASPPSLTRSISAVAFDDRPVNFSWVLALPPSAGGTRGFAVTNDTTNFTDPDALFAFDYVLGTATKIASGDAYTLGRSAGVPGLLLVPDANFSTPLIKLFDVSASPHATTGFTSDPVTGLPPQEVAAY